MPNLEVISAGNAVTLAWRLWTKIPPPPVIYDPPTLPVITIIDPTGAIQINREPMTKLEPGLYGFTYITPSGSPARRLERDSQRDRCVWDDFGERRCDRSIESNASFQTGVRRIECDVS